MRHGSSLVTLLMLCLGFPPALRGDDDAFLRDHIPPWHVPLAAASHKVEPGQLYFRFDTFVERIANLEAISPRPIQYPAGFTAFVRQHDLGVTTDPYSNFFLSERAGLTFEDSIGSLYDASFRALDLRWKYDGAQHAVLTNFRWQRDDPHTKAQMIDLLLNVDPSPGKPWTQKMIDTIQAWRGLHVKPVWRDPNWESYFDHGQLAPEDYWRIAFDALLSQPENFPRDWSVRFVEDSRSIPASSYVTNLFSGLMRDDAGHRHLLIVNVDRGDNLGSLTLPYYLFDENGLFEKGGALDGGQDHGSARVSLNYSGTLLSIQSPPTGSMGGSATFTLNGHNLIRKSGQIGNAIYETSP